MPVPKKRRSSMKSRHKYATWKVAVPTMSKCGQCGAAVYAHYVCSVCGFYRGEYFKKSAKAAKSEKK